MTLVLGALTCIPLCLISVPIINSLETFLSGGASGAAWQAFVFVALPEELVKFLVLVLYGLRRPDFRRAMDGVLYGLAASLGFATIENIMYVSSYGFGTAAVRALTSVPGHALWGGIMGYYAGQACFSGIGNSWRFWVLALLVPVALHGLFDFPLMALCNTSSTNDRVVWLMVWLFFGPGLLWECWKRLRPRIEALRAEKVLVREDVLGGQLKKDLRVRLSFGKESAVFFFGVVTTIAGALLCSAVVAALFVVICDVPGSLGSHRFYDVFLGTFLMGIPMAWFGICLFRSGCRRMAVG
jgi:RsiW-degrading membrane proteinase PrsW (M82 family)